MKIIAAIFCISILFFSCKEKGCHVQNISASEELVEAAREQGFLYCKLLRHAVLNDTAAIADLARYRNNRSAEEHGGILIQLVNRMGEEQFIKAIAPAIDGNSPLTYALRVGLSRVEKYKSYKYLETVFPNLADTTLWLEYADAATLKLVRKFETYDTLFFLAGKRSWAKPYPEYAVIIQKNGEIKIYIFRAPHLLPQEDSISYVDNVVTSNRQINTELLNGAITDLLSEKVPPAYDEQCYDHSNPVHIWYRRNSRLMKFRAFPECFVCDPKMKHLHFSSLVRTLDTLISSYKPTPEERLYLHYRCFEE